MIRVRVLALDARARAARLDGHGWRNPRKLWPDFGDD